MFCQSLLRCNLSKIPGFTPPKLQFIRKTRFYGPYSHPLHMVWFLPVQTKLNWTFSRATDLSAIYKRTDVPPKTGTPFIAKLAPHFLAETQYRRWPTSLTAHINQHRDNVVKSPTYQDLKRHSNDILQGIFRSFSRQFIVIHRPILQE